MKLSTAGFWALAFLLASPLSAQTTGGLDRAEAVGAFLNGALPNRTPRPSTGSWRLVNAFPNLTFIDPVQMVPVPFSNRLMVVEKAGRLTVFNNLETTTSKTVLLDIRSQVESSHDSGMMGLAFHPEFGTPDSPNRHYLYVYYRFTVQKSDTNRAYCRLSRFTWNPATNAIAPSSEYVLINQYDRHNWHNGGGLFFGLDGFLYLSIGDEGGGQRPVQFGSAHGWQPPRGCPPHRCRPRSHPQPPDPAPAAESGHPADRLAGQLHPGLFHPERQSVAEPVGGAPGGILRDRPPQPAPHGAGPRHRRHLGGRYRPRHAGRNQQGRPRRKSPVALPRGHRDRSESEAVQSHRLRCPARPRVWPHHGRLCDRRLRLSRGAAPGIDR